MVNYMATRDGVTFPHFINGSRPATENQKKLIAEVTRALPEAMGLFEHEDYVQAPTIANASVFISSAFEQHPELWSDVRNYVEYLARRPRAEKSEATGHGLWNGGDEPVSLSLAVDEVSNHKGNVWTHVVSLRREDAERLGYADADAWRELVKSKLPVIADSMKIPLHELRWYAAFHNEAHHPHIHLVVFAQNPTHGFLTEANIEKMRSAFASTIFQDELLHIYERKDLARSQVNQFAEERLQALTESLDGNDFLLADMLAKLGDDLKQSKGKKQYGYLKPAHKMQVDEIVRQLAADPRIAEMYLHWCELDADVKRIYTGKVDAPPPLEHEKTFRSIKNMVIRQAMELPEQAPVPPDFPEPEMPDDVEPEEVADEVLSLDAEPPEYSVSWSNEYKLARQYLFGQGMEKDFAEAYALFQLEASSGNALAHHDLGYMHQYGLGVEESMDEAQVWYGKAYRAFCAAEREKSTPYLQYRIGKLHRDGHGTAQDYEQAAQWFERAAGEGNQYAQYSLGGLHQRGLGVEQSDEEALRFFTLSANKGNAYAAYALAAMHEQGVATEVNAEAAQRYYRLAFGKFEAMERSGADDKLQYRLGKMLLDGKGVEVDAPRAAVYLRKAAENKNAHAQYRLGRLILEGKVDGDRSMALQWLTKSAKSGNEFAQYTLGKLYLTDEHKDATQAFRWLTASAEQGNQFAQYRLGNLHLKSEDIQKDIAAALGWLEQSAQQGNQFAQYQLGKLFLLEQDVEPDRERAVAYLTASAAQGNEYARWFLDHMDDGIHNAALSLLRNLANMIAQDYSQQRQRYEQAVDHKLLAKIRRKKQELGQKFE